MIVRRINDFNGLIEVLSCHKFQFLVSSKAPKLYLPQAKGNAKRTVFVFLSPQNYVSVQQMRWLGKFHWKTVTQCQITKRHLEGNIHIYHVVYNDRQYLNLFFFVDICKSDLSKFSLIFQNFLVFHSRVKVVRLRHTL